MDNETKMKIVREKGWKPVYGEPQDFLGTPILGWIKEPLMMLHTLDRAYERETA